MRPEQVWQLGDYTTVGRRWAAAGDALARQVVDHGDRVLDVACGPGSMAVAAACRGATVTGLDISPTLLDAARAQARRAGVVIEWIEYDMLQLPFSGPCFDRVLSAFGCMFAPDPVAMARELHRVCVPGGSVSVLAWDPESTIGRFGPLARPYLPPDAKSPAIEEWGRPEQVAQFFAGLGDVTTSVHSIDIVWPSLDAAVYELTTLVPGWIVIRSLLSDDDWNRLLVEARDLMADTGKSTQDQFVLPTQYLTTHVSVA